MSITSTLFNYLTPQTEHLANTLKATKSDAPNKGLEVNTHIKRIVYYHNAWDCQESEMILFCKNGNEIHVPLHQINSPNPHVGDKVHISYLKTKNIYKINYQSANHTSSGWQAAKIGNLYLV